MPTESRSLYEYAVVRYVPRVERDEFFNVGLIMMCKRRRWIKVEFHIDPKRLEAFGASDAASGLTAQLEAFTRICRGDADAGPIAALVPEERFRWLTAVRSACVQTSRPHPGISDNLDDTFQRLMAELVY